MVNSGAGRPLKKRPSFIYCSRRYLYYTVLGLIDFLSYWLVFSLRKLSVACFQKLMVAVTFYERKTFDKENQIESVRD